MASHNVIAEVSSEAGDEHWLVHVSSGRHSLLSDATEQEGGSGTGSTPFTYVLAGLVACTSGSLRMFAEDRSISLQHVEVDARFVRADDGTPQIQREIRLVGDLDDDDRKQLAQVAERTPVTRALRAGVAIDTAI